MSDAERKALDAMIEAAKRVGESDIADDDTEDE